MPLLAGVWPLKTEGTRGIPVLRSGNLGKLGGQTQPLFPMHI